MCMENINFANIVGRYSLAEAKARIENFLSQYGRQVEAQVWIRILAVYCACHCWKDVLPRLRLFMDSLSDDCPALPRTELTLLRRMMALVGLEPPSWLEEESCLAEENALRHTCEPAVLAVEWLENNSPVLLFREECPACGNVTEFTLRGVLVPVLAREETEWLCPHCLARRLWAPGKVREILWNHYLGVLRALPGASSARLCSDDIDRLLSLAAAMYPIAPVRFGELWAGGVGHLIENTAIYMEYKARGLLSPSLDLIGINKDSSKTNAYLLKKWSETLEIYPAASQLARHVRKTPLEVHELAWYTKAIEWDPCCVMCQSVPPFTFTAREHCRARHNLENMGIPANAPFVCLFVRDSAFDRKVRQISDEQCALYNSRNANVDNYRLASGQSHE